MNAKLVCNQRSWDLGDSLERLEINGILLYVKTRMTDIDAVTFFSKDEPLGFGKGTDYYSAGGIIASASIAAKDEAEFKDCWLEAGGPDEGL